MAFAWYTPTLVQAFGSIKNSDINTNLNAIAAAFNNQNAQTLATGAITIPSSGSRNFLVDMSGIGYGTNLVLKLPLPVVVGDPPVTITLLNPTVAAAVAAANQGGILIDTQGNQLYGVPYGNNARPMLTNAGDTVSLLYVGGSVGWVYTNYEISPAINPANTLPPRNTSQTELWHQSEFCVDTTQAGIVFQTDGINFAGLWGAVTLRSGANTISVGTASQTFNGTAGPYVISVANTRYRFTCDATNTFLVTT